MTSVFHGQRLVAVEKVSGLDFLARAEEAWAAKEILVIGENSAAGLSPQRSLGVRGTTGWWDASFELDKSDLLSQIANTSGTTGAPKAIAISRRAVSDTVARLLKAQELDSSIREYVGVPTTFSFGLGRARVIAAAGGAAYVPGEFRPVELGRMAQEGAVNAVSAVPSMLRVLMAHPELMGAGARKIRWVETGSQHLEPEEKRSLRQLFPNAAILQHYGLTEASRTTFLRIDTSSDDELESVGYPSGDAKVRLDERGRILIAGPHVASGVVSEGMLSPIVDDEGWFRTTDLGALRGGLVHFRGREDDVANVGGLKISAEHFERLLAAKLGDNQLFAAAPVSDDLRGQRLGIFFQRRESKSLEAAAINVAEQVGLRLPDLRFIEVEEIPRTETGKIARSQLAALPEATALQLSDRSEHPSSPKQSANFTKIASIWKEVLSVKEVHPEDSFQDLGGDSLSAVGVLLRAEAAGLPSSVVQQMFDGRSVGQIAAMLDGHVSEQSAARPIAALRMDALNITRGMFALLILLSHWGPFFIERLGAIGSAAWSFLAPLLRIGTPGFAMVFGMGLGLFYFDQLEDGRSQLHRRVIKNTVLLVSGVLLTAFATAAQLQLTGEGFAANWPERLFYTVLLFYALAMPTVLFWLRLVRRMRDRIFGSLLLAVGCYAVYAIATMAWPNNEFSGWLGLAWHMLAAPYAYPRLLGAAALGLAASQWLSRNQSRSEAATVAAKWGAVLGALGVLMLSLVPGGWPRNAGEPWAILPFSGIALLSYAGALVLVDRFAATAAIRMMIVCGVLAFPLFIAQGLVIPTAKVLQSLGLAPFMATVVSGVIFAASMVWLGRRVYVLRFGTATVGL